MARSRLLVLLLAALPTACSSASAAPAPVAPRPVAAASPPRDDGRPAQGGSGGVAHAAALEQLRSAPLAARSDKQNSMSLLLPDAEHWTRVRFLTVPSLVGFRYGKEHHAILAAFVTHVDDNTTQDACTKSFEAFANPWVEAFDVDVRHDPPTAFAWTGPSAAPSGAPKVRSVAIVDVDPVFAKTATMLSREAYAAAWAAYPAWPGACLIVGVAIPARDDEARARAVRDRFAAEVFPKLVVTSAEEPKERF